MYILDKTDVVLDSIKKQCKET